MTFQLRVYRAREGEMDAFVELWHDHIVPARRALGFDVVGAWADRDGRDFAWVVSHPAPDGFAAADAAYYASAERAALPRDPRELLESVDVRVLEAVDF